MHGGGAWKCCEYSSLKVKVLLHQEFHLNHTLSLFCFLTCSPNFELANKDGEKMFETVGDKLHTHGSHD